MVSLPKSNFYTRKQKSFGWIIYSPGVRMDPENYDGIKD